MHKSITMIRKGLLYLTALVLVAGYPVSAMAEAQEPTTESTPPASQQKEEEAPKLNYTYNPETGTWDSEKWQFNSETGQYETPPKPIIIEPKPSDVSTTDKDIDTTVTVDNQLDSNAQSGDASVTGNSKGGDAASGDATSIANVMNVVNSSIATNNNQKVATFTQDIMGDVKGDIVLYPMILKAMLEAKANAAAEGKDVDTSLNATTNFDVNNDVNVSASSGDTTVSKNTKGGNATSGSAHAVANVVNILNSMIAAQDSFIGTINIYGNLEGDILIAPDFIPQMLANNGKKTQGNTKVATQDSTTIVNNITAVANSGEAGVLNNTAAGDAASGDADSNVVIFNVTGHEVVAENSLLVFVNVLGKWVGMIVDAPEGATAAMLGDDVSSHTQYKPDVTVNAQTKHGITNTIAVTAESGDAMVSSNTAGGNATSGNATAQANVANISGSQFNMAGFMGILFINVFQDWHGSLGVNTAYGDVIEGSTSEGAVRQGPVGPVEFVPAKDQGTQIPQKPIQYTLIDSRTTQVGEGSDTEAHSDQSVLAETSSTVAHEEKKTNTEDEAPSDYRILIVAGSLFVVGISALGIRRLLQW